MYVCCDHFHRSFPVFIQKNGRLQLSDLKMPVMIEAFR